MRRKLWFIHDWPRFLLHFPVGIVNVIIHSRSASLSIMFAVGFVFYEVREHLHIHDMAWKDIQGYLFGIGVTGLFFILMGWL